jgi:hypothetical protein
LPDHDSQRACNSDESARRRRGETAKNQFDGFFGFMIQPKIDDCRQTMKISLTRSLALSPVRPFAVSPFQVLMSHLLQEKIEINQTD